MDNQAILERIEGLKELITAKFEENTKDHEVIKAKQDYTNGDVTKLKEAVSHLQLWRSFLLGAWAVISLLLIPIVINYFNNVNNIENKVEAKVQNVMSQYFEKTN